MENAFLEGRRSLQMEDKGNLEEEKIPTIQESNSTGQGGPQVEKMDAPSKTPMK